MCFKHDSQNSLQLSPPQRLLCVEERLGEREKKKVRGVQWEGEREKKGPRLFPFPIVPLALSIFRLLLLVLGYPKEASTKKRGFSVHYRYITMTTIHGHQKWSIRASRKWACPAPAPSPLTCEAWFLRSSMDRFLSHHRTQKLKVKLLPPIRSVIIYTSFYYLSLISNDLAQAFRA